MELRVRPREFFIGRYIYYSNLLVKLGKVSYGFVNGAETVSIYTWNSKTGKEERRRITNKNKEWDKYKEAALTRTTVKERTKDLVHDYKIEWGGSLQSDASHYRIKPNIDNRYDTRLFQSFVNNQGGVTEHHKFQYKGIPMRSEFETEIASILDELNITFKYEVKLELGEYKCRYPDFGLSFPEYNRCGFLEFLGALDSFRYVNKNEGKFSEYNNAGLYIGRDVVYIPGDVFYRPDKQMICEMISTMIGAIARQYLVRID